MKSYSESYKKAGVDVTAGYRAVDLMKKHIARTMTDNVLTGIGGFGGLYELDVTGMEHPVLVSGTDGVGTKLKIAFLMDRHNTIGIDCVAMCVNDIICCGAKPQFFLDYIALGKNVPERLQKLFPVWQKAAYRLAVHWLAAKPLKCRASIRSMNMTWLVLQLVWWIRRRFWI